MRRVSLGIDFGTESCRAIVVDLADGAELAVQVNAYRHGVIDSVFPATGAELPLNWALQSPDDYLESMKIAVRGALEAADITSDEVIGVGVDTTACTLIPTKADATPLASTDRFRAEPFAYAKLWKDHSSESQAQRVSALAVERGESFIDYYSGKISSEWVLPKLLKLYEEAPDVFEAAEKVYECGDWITTLLVGHEARALAVAGFKAAHQPHLGGYPQADYLDALAPGFSAVVSKLGQDLLAPGEKAGVLTAEWAEAFGLRPGIAVAAGHLDAQVAAVGAGVMQPGEMLLVMGTSVCNLMPAREDAAVPGMAGLVQGGLDAGSWAYEAGQAGVGDTFGWFVKNMVPPRYFEIADEEGVSVFEILERAAAAMPPGGQGIVALDWFNGNRSTLMDQRLSGLFVGMTLRTRAEELYRALIESAAFGQRAIFEAFQEAGVPVRRVVACGGLPSRAPLLMQTLADVLDMEIEVSASANTPALGAALHAAVAAGADAGGFGDLASAAAIASPVSATYRPDPDRKRRFDEIYRIYAHLYHQFGEQDRAVMHGLRNIADSNQQEK